MLPDPLPLVTRTPFIPVLTIEEIEQAVPLARALVEGGLPVLEVTLRTPVALQAARAMIAACPEAVIGIGTLHRPADVAAAVKAGARFLVSPGTPASLADAMAGCGVPALPGCATASEAMALAERGFKLLKFFPAEASGGTIWLKAVAEPLPDIRFCPTGGVTAANAADYLALPNVAVVGGTWVTPKQALAAKDFAAITKLAKQAAQLRGASRLRP